MFPSRLFGGSTRARQRLNDADSLTSSSSASQALTLYAPSASSSSSSSSTSTSQRKRKLRYRSRNCTSFRRFGFVPPGRRTQMLLFNQQLALVAAEKAKVRRDHQVIANYESLLQRQCSQIEEQVAHLQRTRALLSDACVVCQVNVEAHAIGIVKRFNEYFANGYDPVSQPQAAAVAKEFLTRVMRPDVICTEFQGVPLFLDQYKVATVCHDRFQLIPQEIRPLKNGSLMYFTNDGQQRSEEDADEDVVQILSVSKARFRINRTSLERFFPSLVQDEALVQRLMGKVYEISYEKVFHFRHGHIFQHESKTDFCSSMLQMAQDPFLTLKLINASLYTKHGHWKVDDRIQEDQFVIEEAVLD